VHLWLARAMGSRLLALCRFYLTSEILSGGAAGPLPARNMSAPTSCVCVDVLLLALCARIFIIHPTGAQTKTSRVSTFFSLSLCSEYIIPRPQVYILLYMGLFFIFKKNMDLFGGVKVEC